MELGPFFLGPVWALANKLELWAILYFVPPVTIFYLLYMPLRGNELAFKKSQLEISDFIKLQETWSKWGIRFFVVTISIAMLFGILDAISN